MQEIQGITSAKQGEMATSMCKQECIKNDSTFPRTRITNSISFARCGLNFRQTHIRQQAGCSYQISWGYAARELDAVSKREQRKAWRMPLRQWCGV